MKQKPWYLVVLLAVVLLAGGIVYSCWDEDEDEDEELAGEYRTLTIQPQHYTITREFTAKIEATQISLLRPQISGRIAKICVEEGATVRKNQPILIIEQAPYQAAVRNAEAKVNSAKAELATARQTLEGKEELFRQHVIGNFDLDKARNEATVAEAALAEAKADLESALADLSFTVIKSPSDGKMSMIEYRVGDMVSPDIELELTVVSDPSRIYSYTGVSEKVLYDLTQYYQCSVDELPAKLPEVTLVTYWGQEHEFKGRIDAISGNAEYATGAVYVRASFDNPSRLFVSGSNGTIRVPFEVADAIVIPQEATYDIQNKFFVYRVADGIARSTEIKVLPYNDGKDYVVTDGLKPGDIIIAEGAAFVKEGQKVKPKQ